jgi:predicted negative regulator of RcsB-dependent stress response
MDEDIAIINTNTRNEKIKNFFINNKKGLIIAITIIILLLISFFTFDEINKRKNTKISNEYNFTISKFNKENKNDIAEQLILIVNKRNTTYSPLALYFIIDNELITDETKINELFDILIEKTKLDKEIKNLIIYKKALYNSENLSENELISILNPIINSDSVWKSHALYLIAEYFFSINEKNKSKEFFQKILILENSNSDIIREAQKRLNRDFSE